MADVPAPQRQYDAVPNNWRNYVPTADANYHDFDQPIVAIEVGTAGVVSVKTITGETASFKCPAGKRIVGAFKSIQGSSVTTATDLVIGW